MENGGPILGQPAGFSFNGQWQILEGSKCEFLHQKGLAGCQGYLVPGGVDNLRFWTPYYNIEYFETSNGSGTLILSELDLTFIKNHNISVLPLLVMERVIFD